jgi:hypothetical protein
MIFSERGKWICFKDELRSALESKVRRCEEVSNRISSSNCNPEKQPSAIVSTESGTIANGDLLKCLTMTLFDMSKQGERLGKQSRRRTRPDLKK